MIATDNREDHPGLLLINSMMQANRVREAIRAFLVERKVTRFADYKLMVDFTMRQDEYTYQFCLRVFPRDSKTPVLTLWSETRDGLVADENLALLMVLYNS